MARDVAGPRDGVKAEAGDGAEGLPGNSTKAGDGAQAGDGAKAGCGANSGDGSCAGDSAESYNGEDSKDEAGDGTGVRSRCKAESEMNGKENMVSFICSYFFLNTFLTYAPLFAEPS